MIEMFVSGRQLLLPDNIQVRVKLSDSEPV